MLLCTLFAVPSLLLFSFSAPVALIQPLLLDGRLSHHPDPLLSCRTSPLLQSSSTCVHRTLGHQYYVCVNGRKRCALILRWPLLNPTHVIGNLYDGGIVGVGGLFECTVAVVAVLA